MQWHHNNVLKITLLPLSQTISKRDKQTKVRRKIWGTMYVSINGPGDPDPDLLTLKLVCEMHLR